MVFLHDILVNSTAAKPASGQDSVVHIKCVHVVLAQHVITCSKQQPTVMRCQARFDKGNFYA